MTGTLFLCATPIGNLGDITGRVLDTLRKVDLIAAEDTRTSKKLLSFYEIHVPMTSYHEHNQEEKGESLIKLLLAGQSIALITDAGTPGISDPGESLVRKCHNAQISVFSLPGATACITALTLSGLSTKRFCFEGFLPIDSKDRKQILQELESQLYTIVIYEAPHRINATIHDLQKALGNRSIAICRELTKKFETVTRTTLDAAITLMLETEPRGEYVLVIEGKSRKALQEEEKSRWQNISLEEQLLYYTSLGYGEKEARKQAALNLGISKREIYALTKIKEKKMPTQGKADKTVDSPVRPELFVHEDMTFVSRLKKIAKECGQILLRATDIEEGIITKAGKANYVTAYDFTIQESLRKSLTDILPSAGFMGEEDPDETQIFSEYVFIVDPIDGTTNFMRDAKASCISIALTFHGNPVVGVVYNPYLEECFWAVEGKGAFLNDKKITVSDKLLQDCLIYFGTSPYEVEWSQKSFSIAYEYFQHAADIRRSGSAALDLCAVACGRGDFFFELCLQPWDYAAASLIVTQAGGVMSDLWGTPITYDRKQIVVARAKNVELLPLSRF